MSWKVSLNIEKNIIEVINSYSGKVYGYYKLLPTNRCLKCGLPGYKDVFCPFCDDFEYLNMIYSLGIYYPYKEDTNHGILSSHIRKLKRWRNYAWPIGASLYLLMKNIYNNLDYDIIAPIPAFEVKISERGYNQAEEIAKVITEKTKIPYEDLLQKTKDVSMTNIKNEIRIPLSRKERYETVKDIYTSNVSLSSEKILLIDDVLTSGANSQECAKILILQGASSVDLIVAGRTREPLLDFEN